MSATKDSRGLHFSEGSSNKFWKIELDGSAHTVTFGRVGTNGQTQTKEFADDDDARKSFDKLISEKLKKGYVDDGASSAGITSGQPTPRKAAAKPKSAEPEPQAEEKTSTTAAASKDEVVGPR